MSSEILIVGGVVIGGVLLAHEMPSVPLGSTPKSSTPNAGSTIGDATTQGSTGGTPVSTKPKYRPTLATAGGIYTPPTQPTPSSDEGSGWIVTAGGWVKDHIEDLPGAVADLGSKIGDAATGIYDKASDVIGAIF